MNWDLSTSFGTQDPSDKELKGARGQPWDCLEASISELSKLFDDPQWLASRARGQAGISGRRITLLLPLGALGGCWEVLGALSSWGEARGEHGAPNAAHSWDWGQDELQGNFRA